MGNFLSFRRSSRSRIHFPSSPAYFTTKRQLGSDKPGKLSLRSLIEEKCPTVFREFHPAWWLFNGDLQTLYCVAGDFSHIDKVNYNRTYLRLRDGGTLGLDFTPTEGDSLSDNAPVIVVLHGLTGGSHESYVRAILSPACAPVKQGGLGYRAVVVNFRGCAGVPVTSPQLYSAGNTEDIRQALMYISNLYPQAPLIGLGFSLGANVLTRYLAEEGAQSRLIAGCALACPWNLAKNSYQCVNEYSVSPAVDTYCFVSLGRMGSNLLKLFKRHVSALAADPDTPIAQAIPAVMALKSPRLGVFDSVVTRLAGGPSPPFPFDTADDYYHWGSSDKLVADIKVPYISFNAADDPIVQEVPMDAGGNDMAVMVVTPAGGHLGWFESQGVTHVRRWITKPVLEWCHAVAEELDIKAYGKPLHVDEDGFLTEEGRDDLGCKVIDGLGDKLVIGTEGEEGVLQGL